MNSGRATQKESQLICRTVCRTNGDERTCALRIAKTMKLVVVWLALLLGWSQAAIANVVREPDESIAHIVPYPLSAYREDQDAFYERQARIALDVADALLRDNLPGYAVSDERRAGFILIDHVMHDDAKAAYRVAVQRFFHRRVDVAIKEIASERVKTGAIIWKIYNDAFVVKTPSVTIGFDLTRGYSTGAQGFFIADDTMTKLIESCDVLFVSHLHLDHADEWVAGQFIKQGKPVITPPQVWAGRPIYNSVAHLDRVPEENQTLTLGRGRGALTVYCYPGHQTIYQNNFVLVTTAEGLTFGHTGDENSTGTGDRAWLKDIWRHHATDVLMPNCWSPDIYAMLGGVQPNLVITGHEDELGHVQFFRQPNWLTMDILDHEPQRHVYLMWGEKFHYQREKR